MFSRLLQTHWADTIRNVELWEQTHQLPAGREAEKEEAVVDRSYTEKCHLFLSVFDNIEMWLHVVSFTLPGIPTPCLEAQSASSDIIG